MHLISKLKRVFLGKHQSEAEKSSIMISRWQNPFEILRNKWGEVPISSFEQSRVHTTELLQLSDEQLREKWIKAREDATTGQDFSHRGWYHLLYAESMRGKKLLDFGSGFAIDGITFAQYGAQVTFVDLVESNLQVVQRLCNIFELQNVNFTLIENIESVCRLDSDYDIILAQGSLHHAPFEIIKPEAQELTRHLKIGGRWLQLAYPKTRWFRDGQPPFDRWGEYTDGPGTPWAEWYDLPKLLRLLEPIHFEVIFCLEFHQNQFIWFDLLKKGSPSSKNSHT